MTKGKQWSAQEEAELKSLVEANTRINEIAEKLKKTPGAIFLKCKRLVSQLSSVLFYTVHSVNNVFNIDLKISHI